jgi:hypothetical protein
LEEEKSGNCWHANEPQQPKGNFSKRRNNNSLSWIYPAVKQKPDLHPFCKNSDKPSKNQCKTAQR